jgi:hypothetical protein
MVERLSSALSDNARAVKNHLRRMARELGVPREALGG